jgi:hypothetical protein
MLSTPINVRATSEAFANALRWHLAPFQHHRLEHQAVEIGVYVQEEDQDLEPAPLSYFRGGSLEFRHPELHSFVKHVLWDINRFVPERSRDFLYLHAGSVGAPEGAVLLPAPANFGKSTMVAAMLREGFSYLSDELGVIDPVTARAYPFPRLLRLDQQTVRQFPGLENRLEDLKGRGGDEFDRFVRLEDLDAAVASPSRIQDLVFLSDARDGAPRLKELTKAEAVERMAANCMNLYRYGDRGVILFSRIASDARSYLLEGGTALERARLLADEALR